MQIVSSRELFWTSDLSLGRDAPAGRKKIKSTARRQPSKMEKKERGDGSNVSAVAANRDFGSPPNVPNGPDVKTEKFTIITNILLFSLSN